MAATTGAAIKAHIETLGLGVPVFREKPPKDTAYPFVTVQDELSLTLQRLADAAQELAQVDLWQLLRHPAGHALQGRVAEDAELVRRLQRGLRRFPLLGAPTLTYQGVLEGSVRLPEPDSNLVHHALTVRVHREL